MCSITLYDGTMLGFLRYAELACQCDRHYGWVCPKCKLEGAWKRRSPQIIEEAEKNGWVAYVVSYDLTPDGHRMLDRLELRTV